jgi:hypothetical protein
MNPNQIQGSQSGFEWTYECIRLEDALMTDCI